MFFENVEDKELYKNIEKKKNEINTKYELFSNAYDYEIPIKNKKVTK